MGKYQSKIKGKSYNNSKKKIETTWNRRAKYKKAFDTVINAYISMNSRSLTKALDFEDFNSGNPNPIQPTILDFLCDVDKTVGKIIKDRKTLRKFNYTFYVGEPKLDKEQINYFEQKLGQMFINRHLWPVDKYFKVIRKKYEAAKG